MLWKTVDVVLAEDQFAIDDDVKNPTTAFDQCRVDVALVLDRSGQTGRGRKVVSLHAVGDRNLHLVVAPIAGKYTAASRER